MTTAFQTEEEIRAEAGLKIKSLDDVNIGRLRYWNYDACRAHEAVGPQADCEYQKCGGEFFKHQRVGIAWCYAVLKGLLADDPGLGKTNIILGLIALLKQKHLLTNRAVIIVQTPAVLQWMEETSRWLPSLHVEVGMGTMTPKERLSRYASNWDVLIIGHHAAIKDRHYLAKLGPFSLVVTDDVDPLLNADTQTHEMVLRLAEDADRSITINATSLQTKVEQLHSALRPAGGLRVFGTLDQFEKRYVRYEQVAVWNKQHTLRRLQWRKTGYKNIDEFKQKLAPLYLRRRAEEIDDISMPTLMPPTTVWLEMSKLQRDKYSLLQQGILQLIRDEGVKVKHVKAVSQFLYGQQICAGLPALHEPDGPGASPKLDWLMDRLTGVWAPQDGTPGTKTIVFIKNPGLVRALEARCQAAGIQVAKVWGQGQNAYQRQAEVSRFRDVPQCQVMIGTTAIERSLNLQVANTLVAVDTHLNWARMKQILGRAKRAGSKHSHVFMFTLLMSETQETGYMKVLARRQALNDAIFEEDTGMYEQLSAIELLQLISPKG